MPSFKRTIEQRMTSTLNASADEVMHFLQHDPEAYLCAAKIHVVEEVQRQSDKGEWRVSEPSGLPFLAPVHYRISWQATQHGSTWRSWDIPLGVYVENSFSIQPDPASTAAAMTTTTLCETALITCSTFVYPIVKPSLHRAHKRLHARIRDSFLTK